MLYDQIYLGLPSKANQGSGIHAQIQCNRHGCSEEIKSVEERLHMNKQRKPSKQLEQLETLQLELALLGSILVIRWDEPFPIHDAMNIAFPN